MADPRARRLGQYESIVASFFGLELTFKPWGRGRHRRRQSTDPRGGYDLDLFRCGSRWIALWAIPDAYMRGYGDSPEEALRELERVVCDTRAHLLKHAEVVVAAATEPARG